METTLHECFPKRFLKMQYELFITYELINVKCFYIEFKYLLIFGFRIRGDNKNFVFFYAFLFYFACVFDDKQRSVFDRELHLFPILFKISYYASENDICLNVKEMQKVDV